MKVRILIAGILIVSTLGPGILAESQENAAPPRESAASQGDVSPRETSAASQGDVSPRGSSASSPAWIRAVDRSMDSLAVLNAVTKDRFQVDPALLELERDRTGEFRLHHYFMQRPLRAPVTLESVGKRLAGSTGLASRLTLLDRMANPQDVTHQPLVGGGDFDGDSGNTYSLTSVMNRVYEGTGKRFQGKDRNQFSLEIRDLPPDLSGPLSRLMLAVLDAVMARNAVLKDSDFSQGGPFNAKSRKTAERLREFLFAGGQESDPLSEEAAGVLAALETIQLAAVYDGGLALARSVDALIDPLKQVTAADGAGTTFQFEWKTPRGRFAVGGSGSNEYIGHYSMILDLGGADRYLGPGAVSGMEPVSLILDMGGEDHYETTDSAQAAPGGAILGYAGIVDLGNARDEYVGAAWGGGFGFLGVGWIFDEGGNDIYEMQWLAQGAGIFGIGLLLDEGGNDKYRLSQRDSTLNWGFGQGFGGPSGIGVHLDLGGDDEYSCPGDATVGSHAGSFHQGAAVGSFWNSPGGLGLLVDAGGNDHYGGSTFAQGAGLDYGVGALIELGGNDSYTAYDQSQGYGMSAGVGVLIDIEGEDAYVPSPGSLCLGVGEDLGMGLFLDVAGEDRYEAGTNSMGVSSGQGAGWFFELSGNDFYTNPKNSVAVSIEVSVDPWRAGVPGVAVFLDLDQAARMSGIRRNGSGSAYFLPRGNAPALGGGIFGRSSSKLESSKP